MNWQEDWDPQVGLWWRKGYWHKVPTGPVHPVPSAAARLLYAAETGQLDGLPAEAVLRALRQAQVTDGSPTHGCMRWYLEEPYAVDTNAAFFCGLSLLVLRKCYAGALTAGALATLDDILADMKVWFDRAVAERMFYYPNKYLGDVVCAWLLEEVLGHEPAPALAAAMLDAADYWRRHGWGWGEHMSDTYSTVALSELDVLLTFSETLPERLRAVYADLEAELLGIEDAFDGGPRVPALRSYAFTASPKHANYRDRIRPRRDGEVRRFYNLPVLGELLYRRGWHDRVPPRQQRARDVRIPCFGGATAIARIEDDVRLGSVSRFPVMPSAENPTWGLSWQCFPVAMWRAEGDWGFLQWQVVENGAARCHPCCEDKKSAHLPKALTTAVSPPITGRTFCLQRGGELVVLRIMPAIAAAWQSVADRFRLIEPHAAVEQRIDGAWSQLVLGYPERAVGVAYVDLTGSGPPELRRDVDRLDWQVTHAGDALVERRMIVGLWAFTLNGPAAGPPEIAPLPDAPVVSRSADEKAWHLRWPWPGGEWRLAVDPLATEPLRELQT